jgi:uncharacterized protein (DUF4213/DUF364 family)
LLSLLIGLRNSLPHFDILRNIRKAKVKKLKYIPKDMPVLYTMVEKWKVVVLGE